MKTAFSIMMVAGATLLLGACATTADLHKGVSIVQGPAIQTVVGPYDAAKACVSEIPDTATINIAVGDVRDVTGRMSMVGSGNGSFLPIVATKMMESSLTATGVKLVTASPVYRGLVDWYGSKGILKGAKLYVPQYLVEGTISSLDFLPGKATSFRVAGLDVTSRSYQAIGRADFSLSTFPIGGAPGGYVVAMTQVSKQFTAIDNGGGVGEFIGGGTGARFASFSIDKGKREPMQYAVGYMTDYAAVELVTDLLHTLVKDGKIPKSRGPEINQCRMLLKEAENPALATK